MSESRGDRVRSCGVAFALLLAPAMAQADFPHPATSTLPAHVVVVGWNGFTPDYSAGRFEVVMRDLGYNPMGDVRVVLDFTGAPGLRLSGDMLDASATMNCTARTMAKFTSADGRAFFTIFGSAEGGSAPPGPLLVRIFANGYDLGVRPLSIVDLDGLNGAGANDLAIWLQDAGTATNPGRGDHDGDGVLGANDLSLWLTIAGRGGSAQSPPSFCP